MITVTVYTAVFGGYDRLCAVQSSEDVEYVAFTDKPQPDTGWTCLTPPVTEPDSRRENRKYKARSHQWFPSSDWTIYLDGNLRLKFTPQEIINLCVSVSGDASLFLCKHNLRNCLYDEAKTCIDARLDEPEIIRSQIDRYRTEGYPAHNGLYWGGLIVRRPGCEPFNEAWWSEVQRGSCRDQISLPYALKKTRTQVGILPGDIPFHGGISPFVERVGHVG